MSETPNWKDELPAELKGPAKTFVDEEAEPSGEPLGFAYKTESERQKINLRRTSAWLAGIVSVWLMILFTLFVLSLLHAVAETGHLTQKVVLDWHIVFFGTLMVLPATVIVLIFAKYAFSEGEPEGGVSWKDIPLAGFLEALIDCFKKLK